jgi:uncharacterized membrane protein
LSKKIKDSSSTDKIDPKLLNNYLKRARISIRDEDYNEAVRYYRLAAKCAEKAGDSQKEKIFNNRADEILEEYGLSGDIEKEKVFKKEKVEKKKALKLTGLGIWGFIITIVIIVLGLSGLLLEIVLLPSTASINELFFFWGIGLTMEIIAAILIGLIYKFFISNPEPEEFEKK